MRLKRVCAWLLIMSLLFSDSAIALNSLGISLTISRHPMIDIVLAKGRTNKTKIEVDNFEQDLIRTLAGMDVEVDKIIQVSSIESSSVDMSTAFNWQTDFMNSSIGSIAFSGGGSGVNMKGNPKLPGKNAVYCFPTKDFQQVFNYNYSLSFGDSFNAAGMLLRVSKTNDVLRGYMISFNNTGNFKSLSGANGGIWKFEFKKGTNSTVFDGSTAGSKITLVKPLTISTSGTLTVTADKEFITISGGGMSSDVTVNIDAGTGSGFGFFSDHYSHNCSSIGNFDLSNISLSEINLKHFSDILAAPEWRDNSVRVVVNVNDYLEEDFSDPVRLGEILSRCYNEGINYLAWGPSDIKTGSQNFINQNNGNGAFITITNSSSYNTAIQETARYIKTFLPNQNYYGLDYMLTGGFVNISISPSQFANNTATTDYPNGRWAIFHDPDAVDMAEGQYEDSGVYKDTLLIEQFTKPGQYDIKFEDESLKTIIVHRMPEASFKMTVANNRVNVVNNSFDLDKYNTDIGYGPGIAEVEWKYKLSTATSWTNGLPSTIRDGETVIVSLRVKDFQEQWSTSKTKYISWTDEVVAPVADFTLSSPQISKYNTNFKISDQSYDPQGLNITKYNWTVTKDGNKIGTYTYNSFQYPVINFKSHGTGVYAYTLSVEATSLLKSDEYTRYLTVVEDTEKPEINVSPQNGDWDGFHNVTIALTDNDSKLKQAYYAITDTSNVPSQWTLLKNFTTETAHYTQTIKINTPVIKYIHVKATDNAGNEIIITRGPFKIDGTAPEIEIIPENGSWKAEHDVQINIEDEYTELTEVKYAVTDGNVTPTSWINATPSNDTKTHTIDFTIDELIPERAVEYYVHVKAKDVGNNEGTLVKGPYQIDGVKPVINSVKATEIDLMPANLDEPLVTNKSVLLEFNITELHSGFDYLEYKLPGKNWVKNHDGEKSFLVDEFINDTIQIRAYDKVGNVSDIFEINNLTIENLVPNITVSQVPEWSNTDIEIIVDGQDNNGVSSIMWQTSESEPQMGIILPDELPATITLSNEGVYSFNATIYDKSGNATRSETRAIRIDKVAPTVGDIAIHAPQNAIIIEEQKAEANLLLAGTSINARTSFASTAADFETWYGRKPIIEIKASDVSGDTNSGVAYITYRMVSDDGSIETDWKKITPDSKGRLFFILDFDFDGTVYVKAYDKANNVSVQYSEWMSIKIPSSTNTGSNSGSNDNNSTGTGTNYAPSLYLSVPNNDVWLNSAKATVIANDNSGLASVKMKVETTNSSVNDYEKELLLNMGNASLNKEEFFTQSGIYDITVTAKDTDGKETVVTGTIKIDNDLPIINGIGTELVDLDGNPVLPDGNLEGKRVKVTVDVIDDLSGLDYLEYRTADSDEWIPVAKGQTSFYISTSYNGTVEVRGYDKAGNGSPKCTSDPISITAPATVEISRPSGWGGTDGKTINIKSTRWDEIDKIVYSYIPADGIEKSVTITSDGTTSSYNKDELFTAPGTYEVVFNIYKKDGNMNIVSREIKIDSITSFKAPSINSFGYEFGSVSSENITLELFYHPEDMPASGIARYEYKDPVSGQWMEGIPTFDGETDNTYIFRAISNSGLVSETTEPVKVKISSTTNYFPTLELANGNIGKDYLIQLNASDWVEKKGTGYLYIWEDGKVGNSYTPVMKVLSSDSRVSILGDAIYIDGEGILNPGTTYWITADADFVQDGFYNSSKALNKVCFKTEKAPSVEINSGAGNDILISTGKPSGSKTEYDIFLEPGFSGELELVIPNGDTIKNSGSEGGLVVNGNGNSLGITIPEDADLENGKIIVKTENGDELIFNVIPSEINVNLNIDPSTGVSNIDKNTVISSIDFTEYLEPGYSADVTLNVKHGSGNRYSDDIEKAENIIKNSLKYNDLSKPIVIEALVSVYDKDGNIVDELVVDNFRTPLEIEIEINGMNDFNHSDFGAIFSPANNDNCSFINDVIKSYDKMTIGLTSPGEIFVTSKEDFQDVEEEDYDRNDRYDDDYDDDDRDYDNNKGSISWEEKLGLDKVETEENKTQINSTINLPPLTNTNKEYYKPDLNWYNHIPESMKGVSDINILRDTYCIVPISVNNPDMIAPYSYVNPSDMFEFVKPSDETYALVKNHHDFNDMTYNWAYAAVHAMASREIVVGYPDGGFHPNNNITRGEFATMLARLEKLPLGTYTSSYNDVSINDWYHPYIEAVTAAGYMNGYNNGNFGPKDPITREQMAATLYRYLQYRGWMPDTTDMGKIADKNSASAYAVDGINALYNLGIITGYPDSTFKPRNNATRAETCNMIWKLILNEVNNRYDTFELDIFDVDQNTTGPKHEFYL